MTLASEQASVRYKYLVQFLIYIIIYTNKFALDLPKISTGMPIADYETPCDNILAQKHPRRIMLQLLVITYIGHGFRG